MDPDDMRRLDRGVPRAFQGRLDHIHDPAVPTTVAQDEQQRVRGYVVQELGLLGFGEGVVERLPHAETVSAAVQLDDRETTAHEQLVGQLRLTPDVEDGR
jgi:hypothetical protein